MPSVIKANRLRIFRPAEKFIISKTPGLRHTQQVVLGPRGFVPVHSVEVDQTEFPDLTQEQAEEVFGQIRSIFQRLSHRKEE